MWRVITGRQEQESRTDVNLPQLLRHLYSSIYLYYNQIRLIQAKIGTKVSLYVHTHAHALYTHAFTLCSVLSVSYAVQCPDC